VDAVDRLKVARALGRARAQAAPLEVALEVNGGGVWRGAPGDVPARRNGVTLPGLRLVGPVAIPPENDAEPCGLVRALAGLRDQVATVPDRVLSLAGSRWA
jgi:uncharacterized pyridoxal phosphate-containing UPF0001 family protein